MITRISYCITLLLFIIVSSPSKAQNINTLAGTGAAGFSGDGGPATAAKINTPYAVTADAMGNVYFGDFGSNRIRKIDAAGVISTIAGNGTTGSTGDGGQATAARIGSVYGIALDHSGNLFFSDNYNVVRKVNISTGIISTVAGIAPTGSYNSDGIAATGAYLNLPYGIAFDNANNLLIADQLNNRIRKVDMSSGIISTICGTGTTGVGGDGGPATAAILNYPSGVAVSITGNIYIADYGNNRIRKINPSGNISTITYPGTTGSYGYSGDGGPSTAAHLYYPVGVAVDSTGNVYISDQNNNTIRKINSFGIISSIAGYGYMAGGSGAYGGDGGLATAAWLNQPSSCFVTASLGKIYIADKDNHRIRVIGTLHKPTFTNGRNQYITTCQGVATIGLDTILAVDDIDVGQTEIWSIVSPATHGSLTVGYSATSTGGTIIPSGLIYSPFVGLWGADSFSVRVFDGTGYDTTVVRVNCLPTAVYNITGRDSVCPGDTTTLTYSVPGGTFASLRPAIATVTPSGFVTALTPGHDTITYTYSNACGTVTSILRFTVGSYLICHTGVATLEAVAEEISAYPNPSYNTLSLQVSSSRQEEVNVTITNMLGEKVKEFTTITNTAIELQQDYPAGIYFISARNAEKRYLTKMITKL